MASNPSRPYASDASLPTIGRTNNSLAQQMHASLRRDKPTVSCKLCRRRKVRCDRKTPCGTCCRRGLASSCVYGTNSQEFVLPRPAGTVHERIHHLESLVISLMRQDTNNPATEIPASILISDPPSSSIHVELTSTTDHPLFKDKGPQSVAAAGHESEIFVDNETNNDIPLAPLDGGFMKLNGLGAPNYVGSSHWAAVLDSIVELKDHLDQEEETRDMETDLYHPVQFSSPQLLYGGKPATEAEIASSIPSRRVADRLVSRYFMLEIAPGVLHSGQFLRQYEEFWEDPSGTPIMWIGLLLTILCLGAHVQAHQLSHSPKTNPSPLTMLDFEPELLIPIFRERIVQCLNLGKHTKGGPHVLETLIQYYMIEHFLRQDAEFEIWILLGMLIPISLRMGIHRDPKHFTDLSPFAGEMRRRIWATIFQIDVGFSALAGLPRMIKPQHCDTQEPRNLWDTDFDERTIELPQSKPETETTPILYLLAKNRLLSVGGIISDLAHDVRPYPYRELERVERLLKDTRNALPLSLQWQPLSQSIIQGPQAVMQRVYLELCFHKMQIILYKKYISASMTQPQYTHAREVCIDSAMKILEYQHLLDEEMQLDHRLSEVRWTYASIFNHDFMLAASVLCFCIKACNESDMIEMTVQKIYSLLRKSREIWIRSSTVSSEAQKAVRALSIILGIMTLPPNNEVTDSSIECSADFFARYNNPPSWPAYQDPLANFSLPHFDFETMGGDYRASTAVPENFNGLDYSAFRYPGE